MKVESPGFADGCIKERKEPRIILSFLMWGEKKKKKERMEWPFTEMNRTVNGTDLKGKIRSLVGSRCLSDMETEDKNLEIINLYMVFQTTRKMS